MLPGMYSSMLLNQGAAPSTVSLFSKTGATGSATIAWPASLQYGDVAVLMDWDYNSSLPTAVTPTGFTNQQNLTISTFARFMLSTKICTGSETGNITGLASDLASGKNLLIFRPDVPASLVTVSSFASQLNTGGSFSSQTITSGSGQIPLAAIACHCNNSGGIASAPTSSPAFADSIATQTYLKSAWTMYNSSPVDNVVSSSAGGSLKAFMSWYITLQ